MGSGKTMGNKRIPFEPNTMFHVYNHGNADDNIFREEENYRYFLKRYVHYVYPIARTYAFCQMPNHFHFMIKIRSHNELNTFFKSKNPQGFRNPEGLNIGDKISHQFGTLLNAYTKSYNSYYDRRGSLFRNTTKRKTVKDDTYYNRLIYYIHQNPVRHGFVASPQDWPFSSYHIHLSQKQTKIEREEVLDWLGGRTAFEEFHRKDLEIEREKFY